MADKTYATAEGFIQFPVESRDVNGQTVRDATIRTPGTAPTGGKLIKVTLWSEFESSDIQKGDWIAVDGTVEVREVGDKTYVNMNVKELVIQKGEPKASREVVSRKPAGASKF